MKINLYHKINLETHDYEKKVSGIEICCGKYCLNSCWCKHGNKCKYHKGFGWHNFCVNFNRFFYYHFHLDIHIPLYIRKFESDFSGTSVCPYHTERMYSCWDCKYCGGGEDCTNKKRYELIKSGKIDEVSGDFGDGKCKLFELSDYGKSWDKKTGERIFN